jgi:hypothetical protein
MSVRTTGLKRSIQAISKPFVSLSEYEAGFGGMGEGEGATGGQVDS